MSIGPLLLLQRRHFGDAFLQHAELHPAGNKLNRLVLARLLGGLLRQGTSRMKRATGRWIGRRGNFAAKDDSPRVGRGLGSGTADKSAIV